MTICDNLVHPFQTDSGTSQRQRIAEVLWSDAPPIDGRKMADLLDYFVQLSRHINYYNAELKKSDWQPFFKKSIPFTLATIIKFDTNAVNRKVKKYNKLFDKHPSKQSLQLLLHFVYYYSINRINDWQLQLKDTGLPVETAIEQLIKDKLKGPVKDFIRLCNTAASWYKIKRIDFSKLQKNEVWNLSEQDLQEADQQFQLKGKTKRSRLISLRNEVTDILPSFINMIAVLSASAEKSMEQSLFPLKEELKELHSPHLGLLFSFLKLFQYLQSDLNSYTRKHLDFFYREVLKFKPREASPDKAHILFEIQNQLDKFLLKKGLLVKDGKDKNKAEIIFSTDDEIVVNKAIVSDVRTLFLNQQTAYDHRFVEGVYIAPDARKADGQKIDFKDSDPKNWPTVGNKYSKYTDPEQKFIKPYPNARMGFILASPVLLLNEGHRTIDIALACSLTNNCNQDSITPSRTNNCCEKTTLLTEINTTNANSLCNQDETRILEANKLYTVVSSIINKQFYYVSKDLIGAAIKKGFSTIVIEKLLKLLTGEDKKICYCTTTEANYDATIEKELFEGNFIGPELILVQQIFKPQRPLKISFSGQKEWVEPSIITLPETPDNSVAFGALSGTNNFTISIKAILKPDKPAITFYDKEKLKEDFNTQQPLVKIELNDFIKNIFSDVNFKLLVANQQNPKKCCLLEESTSTEKFISLYHFFRNVTLEETGANKTEIKVTVCGLKNFIVQNDESVQDVNAPVYPFGTRPVINNNFYIGSKEIFSKNWQNININHNWKDLPVDGFEKHYTAYQHMVIDPNDVTNKTVEGVIKDKNYKALVSLLYEGAWLNKQDVVCDNTGVNSNNLLFQQKPIAEVNLCGNLDKSYEHLFKLQRSDFADLPLQYKKIICPETNKLTTDTRNCFLRFQLKCQDFQHTRYAFILSRQMMAFSRLPNELVAGAFYRINPGNAIVVFNNISAVANDLEGDIATLVARANTTKNRTDSTRTESLVAGGITGPGELVANAAILADNAAQDTIDAVVEVDNSYDLLKINIPFFPFLFPPDRSKLEALIPNEPWTPIIKNIALDYIATADKKDIDLIHLYPYEGTYKQVEIELNPTLFPTFCDEGNLFIGLQKLVPGSNLNLLFQLAEATADAESERENITWYYLDNNNWKELRTGFEVLNDDTNGLTTSGIIKFSLPATMTSENTILPKNLHWIKAGILKNSRSVSETIGIHTQAIKVVFTNDAINDKMRLEEPLPAESISKLKEADSAVKKLIQPYESIGGRIPEIEGQFYIRISELLRHKGRAIQKFDYERLVLEAFPEIFKVKCINHSYGLNAHKFINDFPIAPGHVLLAVIPDLTKLKAGKSFEPRVPVSILETIFNYLCKRTSPFVRLKVMNPRYEKINFCLKVKLYPGKDEVYYKEKLQQDLREFLAPWAIGEYYKLTFGQCANRSDIVGFLETREYIDYILDLRMAHESASTTPSAGIIEICPHTPRSILIAGDIDICINQNDCEDWDKNAVPCVTKAEKLIDYCKNEDPIIT